MDLKIFTLFKTHPRKYGNKRGNEIKQTLTESVHIARTLSLHVIFSMTGQKLLINKEEIYVYARKKFISMRIIHSPI